MQALKVYNTLSREKEIFTPLNYPHVGMYVCGPTVYNYVHLGNCRTFTSFDLIYRYLKHLGYKVRYVRNITDVGHLENDADEGEDKIGKKAKLENLEPMEIVQRYTLDFRSIMQLINNLPPSIEPTATGHILEQIEMVQKLLDKDLAYEAGGSVYFDVGKYNKGNHQYGKLSGRIVEDLIAGSRDLDGQQEKHRAEDFALWKKASHEHIMRWHSPWSEGFPGWHLECSVMSSKYLGMQFDIHGGGMDLKFPHHECEIAQSKGANDVEPVKYWLHTNMLTVNGTKMSKSLGNSILPHELFMGTHKLLSQAYSPMVLRFMMLQTHYRSTMDISDDALKGSQKSYKRVMNGLRIVKKMKYEANTDIAKDDKQSAEISQIVAEMYEGMNDDFNTAVSLAALFNLLKKINSIHNGLISVNVLDTKTFDLLKNSYIIFVEDIFGLREENSTDLEQVMNVFLEIYKEAKHNKNFEQVDKLRSHFKSLGVVVNDMKDKIDWSYEE